MEGCCESGGGGENDKDELGEHLETSCLSVVSVVSVVERTYSIRLEVCLFEGVKVVFEKE